MFSNFVSLGVACPTASSMSKYGLRSWSGPFDWLVTNSLEWVLYFIENNFTDFLEKKDLERFKGSSKKFINKKSGFIFLHDQEFPFEEKFDELQQKYKKRIDKFMEEIKKPTCFLRSVIDANELSYLSDNAIYIDKVLKRSNAVNELVLLIHREVELPTQIPFRHYIMHGEFRKGHEMLRSWFDNADAFLEFCAENYSAVSMIKNIAFDHKKELQFQHKKLDKAAKRYDTLVKLCDFDFSSSFIPKSIIIYGAGYIGRSFYKKAKGKCEIQCFVDKKEKGKEIDEIPIIGPEEVYYDGRAVFVITATQSFEEIKGEIKVQYNTANVISLDEILL